AASGDKTYRIRETFDGTTIDRDLKASDGAPQSGGFWTSVMSWVTSDFIFHILDLKGEGLDSIADELTYVFPTMMTVDGPSEDLVTFGVFGSRPGQLPSTLPERYLSTDGIATFSGKTNGIFSDVDKRLYRTRSSFQLQANFRTDRIFGFSGPTQISPMSTPPTSDPPRFVNGDYLDFRLDGTINRFEMTYSANAQQTTPNPIWGSMNGEASGMFFGSAGTAPDETGFVFQMSTPDGRVRYFGVGAADHELASRPFLTPLTTVNSGRGPSVMITGAGMGIFGTRGTGSSITASTLLNVSPDVTASFRPGATQDYKDDNFALSYNVNGVNLAYAWQYLGFAETDNFGTAYSTMVGGNGAPVYDAVHHNIGFDLGPSLAGALDNVFLVSIMGDKFSTEQTYGYIVFGNQTAAADMPTTGSASFTGETRGVYLDSSGQLFRTGSDLTMTANFGSGAINGAATNFMTVGDYFPGNSRDKLDFTFSGSINSIQCVRS
ncbi:MAG: hypothetical protein B7Z26_07855, partial [Asticcacaulis sp. 32-58-5]